MHVFNVRDRLIGEYARYVRGFIHIRDERIEARVAEELDGGLLWPEPLLQLNPSFEPGGWVDELVADGTLHPECARVFRRDKSAAGAATGGRSLRFYPEARATMKWRPFTTLPGRRGWTSAAARGPPKNSSRPLPPSARPRPLSSTSPPCTRSPAWSDWMCCGAVAAGSSSARPPSTWSATWLSGEKNTHRVATCGPPRNGGAITWPK
jgi:hypothetical protein